MSKYLESLKSDPRVADVSDERGFGDGYFVALADGYDTGDEGTTVIHEYTVKELRQSMAHVRKIARAEENKPCPFCGAAVDQRGWLAGDGKRGPECEGCGSTAPDLKTWNTRV